MREHFVGYSRRLCRRQRDSKNDYDLGQVIGLDRISDLHKLSVITVAAAAAVVVVVVVTMYANGDIRRQYR